jgi:hypothetical protein
MKKLLLVFGLVLSSIYSMNAQDISKNAIGIRFGDNSGLGGEISYQRALGENNRLEVDLGIRNSDGADSFKATGIYQWVWNLENKFNWYAGVGGGLGSFKAGGASETFFFGAGNIGIEYNFDAPILISLDYRPEFGFSDVYDGLNSDIALSVRYQF